MLSLSHRWTPPPNSAPLPPSHRRSTSTFLSPFSALFSLSSLGLSVFIGETPLNSSPSPSPSLSSQSPTPTSPTNSATSAPAVPLLPRPPPDPFPSDSCVAVVSGSLTPCPDVSEPVGCVAPAKCRCFIAGDISLCYQMGDEEANSGTATGGDYDVFLSFRGPDTRNGFTDCLYVFMRDAGIRIFRDDEELRPGEKISEILQAVKRSRIYIPIFSKDYASSKWCLRELTCMVECTRQPTGKEILPIFYDVDPSDVKLETELYNSALRKHEKELGCDPVKPWKEALKTVPKTKGWRMKDQGQGKVIKNIIEEVSQKVAIRKRDLPTNLVGIEDRMETMKKLLDCGTGDVRFVIIHGIGGIGKTTLAKTVFNQLSPRFECCSFVADIQESSSSGGVAKVQRKLVADLFGFSLPETSDFEEGNNIIRKRLPTRQILLVFDNVDENDKFMQLLTNCFLCGPGSRIIVTTRDMSVFRKIKSEGLEEKILIGSTKILLCEMKEMNFDHALQLFNKLAFNTDAAPCDLDLSREVVRLAGGLPLVLEVIGSHLRTIDKAKWKSTLKKLKEVPPQKVQQRLRISYDALGDEAQQIFLDIACFFVNKKKTNAMYFWEACDLFPEVEIDVLIDKSLIKIDHDRIWMHDQLRDLGRSIAREENIGKLGDRARLGFIETALDKARARKGTENVIAFALWRSRHNFTREDFTNLMNARFLELDGGNFAGNFEEILPELRWLCWRNCPSKLQANNFMLNHLVVLKLSGDITTYEWSRWAKIMVASKLKVLKIAGSKSLMKTPDISKLTSLERLILKDFPRLTQIDHSVVKLERLIYLKIEWCPRLSLGGLPKEIGQLTALKIKWCLLPSRLCPSQLTLLAELITEFAPKIEIEEPRLLVTEFAPKIEIEEPCLRLSQLTARRELVTEFALMKIEELELIALKIKWCLGPCPLLPEVALQIEGLEELKTEEIMKAITKLVTVLRTADRRASENLLRAMVTLKIKEAVTKLVTEYRTEDRRASKDLLREMLLEYNILKGIGMSLQS